MFRRFLLASVPLGLAYASFACTESTRQWDEERMVPTAITIVSPWIFQTLAWSAVLLAVGFVLLPRRLRTGWTPRFDVAVGGLLLVLMTLCGGWMFPRGHDWHVVEEGRGPDGATYAILRQLNWGDGPYEVLGRQASTGLVRTSYAALIFTGINNGRPAAPMIGNATTREYQLDFGVDGRVTAVHQGECHWFHDTLSHTSTEGEAFATLSPFALLGNSTPGRESDLQAIVARVTAERQRRSRSPGTDAVPSFEDAPVPSQTPLLDALDSPNAWIRAAARRIVEAGGAETYPEATRKLAPR